MRRETFYIHVEFLEEKLLWATLLTEEGRGNMEWIQLQNQMGHNSYSSPRIGR